MAAVTSPGGGAAGGAGGAHGFEPGHADSVHDAQFDYYGRRLATASSDATVKLFDVLGGGHQHLADLVGHQGPVWQVRAPTARDPPPTPGPAPPAPRAPPSPPRGGGPPLPGREGPPGV